MCLASLTLFIQLGKGYAAIASILAFEIIINSTIASVHWIYLPEVLTDTQFGFVVTFCYLNGMEVAVTTEWLMEAFTPAGVFLLYTVFSSLGFVFMYVFLRETKGLPDWQKKQIYMPRKYQQCV